MRRISIHMKAILMIFFLLTGTTVMCQDDFGDTLAVPPPPAIEEETSSTTYSENDFDSFSFHTPTVLVREIHDSTIKKLQNQKEYWYANQPPVKKKPVKKAEEPSFVERPWVNSLLWFIIIGGFVAVLVWYLASSNISLFRKKSAVISLEEDEVVNEDIFEIRFEKEIQAAIASQNYRLATRLMYLRTLRELSDRQLIHFTQEKTNSEYLFQLFNTKYYKQFFQLTREFEYIWYGKFQLSPEAFSIVEKDFTDFKQQLS
jgi:hypothetical protein